MRSPPGRSRSPRGCERCGPHSLPPSLPDRRSAPLRRRFSAGKDFSERVSPPLASPFAATTTTKKKKDVTLCPPQTGSPRSRELPCFVFFFLLFFFSFLFFFLLFFNIYIYIFPPTFYSAVFHFIGVFFLFFLVCVVGFVGYFSINFCCPFSLPLPVRIHWAGERRKRIEINKPTRTPLFDSCSYYRGSFLLLLLL